MDFPSGADATSMSPSPRGSGAPKEENGLSLRDVLNAHPAEDPSETKLIHSLEEGSRRSIANENENIIHASSPSSPPNPPHENSPSGAGMVPPSPPPKAPAVEDELAHLTSSFAGSATGAVKTIRQLYKRSSKSSSISSFDRDAAKLMSRAMHGKKTPDEESKKDETGGDGDGGDDKRNANELSADQMNANVLERKDTGDLMIMREFKAFMSYRKESLLGTLKKFLLYSLLPFGGLAAFLFYAFPSLADVNDRSQASVSWWILFIGVRQVFTLMLAKFTEAFLIDFLAVQTRVALYVVGPFFTLMLVQSKGWTFQLFTWATIDYLILYGDNRFARHWLYFLEDFISLFSQENTAGNVVASDAYGTVLFTALLVAAAVAFKRFFLGLWYGQSVYRQYGEELTIVMKKVLLIQKVAALANDKYGLHQGRALHVDYGDWMGPSNLSLNTDGNSANTSSAKSLPPRWRAGEESKTDCADPGTSTSNSGWIIDTTKKDPFGVGELNFSQKLKIADLLGEWEEPVTNSRKNEERASISAVVNFRAAMSVIDHAYPFSEHFGRASTREECIESSQRLFVRLEESDGEKDGRLNFDLLAAVALNKSGELDTENLKSLIEVFRPTRDGELTMLDFVKSIDSIYKKLRIFEASVDNARKMNAASQEILDGIFHCTLVIFALSLLGVDTVALIGSITAVVVGLAFMIGGATSNWLEGTLFMLVRKPYGIGDRIAVSAPNAEVSGAGSAGWIVKDVNLYYTTVIFGTTFEEATYSNFSLSTLRVINHNRSPKAFLNFVVRVGIATPKEKIQQFAEAVKDYIKERPREWLNFTAFRLSSVQVDQGYAEYTILMQHRESWQQIAAILNSRADVQMYAYELSKQLGIEYESPPRPIIIRNKASAESPKSEGDWEKSFGLGNAPAGSGGK